MRASSGVRSELTGNAFLDSLSAGTRAACTAEMRLCDYAQRHLIAHKGDAFTDIYFPLHGVLSEVEEGSDGGTAEVTLIGFEGCSGIEALVDATYHPFVLRAETPLRVAAIAASTLIAARDRSPEFHTLVHRYLAARIRGAGISIGCYARHPVHARLARWLLRMYDRTLLDTIDASHETMASLLGVTRPTVTLALGELVSAGLIEQTRSRVRILSVPGLVAKSCSCYPDARDLFTDLYGSVKRTSEIS